MNINRDTKLKEVIQAFPQLMEEAVNLEPKFRILNNPVGKVFLKHATIADLSKRSGLSVNEILNWIKDTLGK